MQSDFEVTDGICAQMGDYLLPDVEVPNTPQIGIGGACRSKSQQIICKFPLFQILCCFPKRNMCFSFHRGKTMATERKRCSPCRKASAFRKC